MKHKIFMLFALLLSTLGAVAQNTLRLADVTTSETGKSVTMPVYMDNADEIVAVEFTLTMPEGSEVLTDRCALTDNRKVDHAVSVAYKSEHNGVRTYKVTAYSPLNKAFVGLSGKLMNLVVSVPEYWMNDTTYPVTLSKVILSKRDGSNVTTASSGAGIKVNDAAHCDILPTITSVAPLAMKAGEQVTVSWTVKNQGEVDATGGWNTKVSLIDENEEVYVLSNDYTGEALAVGSVQQITKTYDLPTNLKLSGKVKVAVELIGSNKFNEDDKDKANNCSSTAYVYTVEKAEVMVGTSVASSMGDVSEGQNFRLGIKLAAALTADVDVKVSCSVPSRFVFDKVVTIPAGKTEAAVNVTAYDDNEPSMPVRAIFTITGEGLVNSTCAVNLSDNDVPELQLSFDKERITEGGTSGVLATITRTTNIDKKVTVKITDDSAEGELTYGTTSITLAAGQKSAQFAVGVKDNDKVDGTRTVNVSAAVWFASCNCGVEGGETGHVSQPLVIVDNDSPMLTVTTEKASIPEGGSMLIIVSRNNTASGLVNLNISTSNDNILESYTKSLSLAADATSATVNIKAKSNETSDGNRTVKVTVTADGYEAGVCSFIVTDENRPDLSVGALSVVNAASAGETVDVSVALANEGHGAAASPQTVEILWSDKAMYSASSVKVLVTLTSETALAAGESVTLEGKVVLPIIPGNVWLFARVEDANGISTANNISAAAPVALATPFTASVTLDKTTINAGGVVTISGTTAGTANKGANAKLYYKYGGELYPIQTVTTDSEGAFSLQWAAPANMPGKYEIGACYEGAAAPDNTVALEVLGLKAYNSEGTAGNSFMYLEVDQGQTATGFFKLENPGNAAIENLAYNLVGVPEGWTVKLASSPASIAGGKTVSIEYTVIPTTVTVGKQTIYLQVASGELQLLNLKGQVGCVKAEAELVLDVNEIKTNVAKGVARDYRLMLTNTGNGNTGKISFILPEWMTVANAVGTLAKNDTVVAIIRMNPEGEANTRFNGNIGISTENGNSLSLPFNINIVSTEEGTLQFDVCDEFTYYDESQPKVTNASIVIRNAATNAVAAELTNGNYEVSLTEGYYRYIVTAPGHDSYENSVLVTPGETTSRTVNLSISDNISIDYQIVETEEEDGYEIVTTATFETVVPVPQVTLSVPGRIRCDDLAMGESMIIQATVINQGLVTAKELTLYLPETKDWKWEAISPATIDLRPKESSSVFIRITRVDDTDEDDCMVMFTANYTWSCGDEHKSRDVYAVSVIKNKCKPKLPCQCQPVTPVEDDGIVIARVKIQFDQTMTMTRQGFRGTLTVENNSDMPMENIMLALTETAPDGSVATSHEFEVTFEEKVGFSGSLGGPWGLAAGEKGIATIKYLPTKYAAPTEPVEYVFGGNIAFTIDGKERRRELADQTMTVKPSPDLDLHYFMQRDLISDDALTKDVIEETEEGEFALLINNVGHGEAKNVKLVTAQPELVDNESGLLLDIEFTSSQLNGGEKALAFGKNITTDFGTIPAQGQAYAQWWMTTSLLGHFIDYQVEYTHLTASDNPDLSLINNVSIHELIRSVEVPGSNMRGFAANDVKDEECMPDVMYFTDGTTATITTAQDAAMVKVDDNTYTISVTPSQDGWTYARIADLTKGGYTIEKVTRDGVEVPLRNVWQSWAVMRDSMRPEHVDNIHLIDRINATATYTVLMQKKPDAVIELQQILYGTEDGIAEYNGNIPVLSKENQFVDLMFNVPVKAPELDEDYGWDAFSLMIQGEKVALPRKAFIFDGEYVTIDMRAVMDNGEETGFAHLDGFYSLTVNTAKLQDEEGNVGLKATTVGWVEQTGKPVELKFAYSHEDAGVVRIIGEQYLDQSIGDDGEVVTPGEPFVELEGSITYDEPQIPKNEYRYGTILTMKVTPAYGYDFNRWSQNGTILSTEDTYTYMLTAPKVLKLFFTPKKFNLAVNVPTSINPDGNAAPMGTVVGGGSGIYEYGEEVTLTATAAQGYEFQGWYESDYSESSAQNVSARRNVPAKVAGKGATLLTTSQTVTYTVTDNKTIYPVFIDPSVTKGDVNGDGVINAQDAQLVIQHYLSGVVVNEKAADINEDGKINAQDAQLIIQMYLNK